ncbi:membrane bound O-acyl transferase family-domain-containing protein [Scleroderma yunnanense]
MYYVSYHSKFVAILAMRSIVWTFVRKPLQRFPVQVKVPSDTKSRMPTGAWGSQQTNIKQALWNACDLCVNLRGIGWSWSPFCNLKEVTSQGRVNFLFKTAAHVAFYALAVDVATESVHIVAPTTIGRGTILDTSLPYPKRLFHAAAAACIFIVHLYSAMELIYNVSSFCCVSWLGQDPAQWPPMFDQPWQSTSLGEFWGRRWHQLFRDCFVSLGSRPFIMLSEKLSSVPISVDSNKAKGGRRERQASRNPLPVLGAFFISGVLHDMGCRSMGNKDPVRIIGFFMMQAVGVILERILAKRLAHSFRTADGPGLKTEHTLLARIWVALWLLLWGIPFVDAWAQAGLLGVRIFPEPLKPLRIVQVVWNMTTANLVSFLTSRLG